MRVVKISVIAVLIALITACASPEPVRTPIEIQSIQTRSFEAPKDVVFPSVISVFQDLGYSIQDADFNTGLISAESAADSNTTYRIFWGTTRISQTKATAFIEEIGGESSVRLSFIVIDEKSGFRGQRDRQDTPVLDADTYQNAFERIENAIFVRSSS